MWEKLIKDEKGATSLIELIVYIALYAIIITAATAVFVNFINIQQKITFIAANDADSRIALNRMSKSIEEGFDTLTPSTSVPTSSTLTVQTDSAGDTATYSLTNGQLFYQYDSQTAVALTSTNTSISNLTFTRESTGGMTPTILIQITFTTPVSIGNAVTYIETLATQRSQ